MGRQNLFSGVLALVLLGGCGSSTSPPTAPAVKANVTVSVDGQHHACIVSLSSEAQGSTVGCAEVVSFVKDELRVAVGSSYDLHSLAPANEEETNKVKVALDGAGYRFVGGASGR